MINLSYGLLKEFHVRLASPDCQLLPEDKSVIVGNTQILHINKVEPNDEGCYVCTICNSSGGTVETNPTELISTQLYVLCTADLSTYILLNG